MVPSQSRRPSYCIAIPTVTSANDPRGSNAASSSPLSFAFLARDFSRLVIRYSTWVAAGDLNALTVQQKHTTPPGIALHDSRWCLRQDGGLLLCLELLEVNLDRACPQVPFVVHRPLDLEFNPDADVFDPELRIGRRVLKVEDKALVARDAVVLYFECGWRRHLGDITTNRDVLAFATSLRGRAILDPQPQQAP